MTHRQAAVGHAGRAPSRLVLSIATVGEAIVRRMRHPSLLFRRSARITSIKGMTQAQFAEFARRSGIEAQLANALVNREGARASAEAKTGVQGGAGPAQ